jgi:hypothetical protein
MQLNLLKNIALGALTLGLMMPTFTSCEAEVVDLTSLTSLSDNTAFETPERCLLALMGAYDAAQCGVYNGSRSRGYPFGAASIEQGEMRGEDMNLTAVFYDVTYSSGYSTATANNQYFWEASFEAINQYNVVKRGIEGAVENGVLTAEVGNSYIAEVLFLRALTYQTLMTHFALPVNISGNNNYGLPLYLTPHTSPAEVEEGLKIGRSTVAETYAQIIKDLDEAENLFAGNDRNSGDVIARASKGTAIALKTRVYLHMRDWEGVIREAKKIVIGDAAPFSSPIGGYKLEADPMTPFSSYAANTESIFSVANSSDDNASVNGSLAQMMSDLSGGRAIVTSSPTIYNTSFWLPDDKRRAWVSIRESDKYGFTRKYTQTVSQEEYAPIMRYAEVLLNYAEAALRSGDKTTALTMLNAVRDRSLADPATQSYTAASFDSDAKFMEAIAWERRIELQAEGQRWADIHRLAADDLYPTGGIPAKIDYQNAKSKDAFVAGKALDPAWYSASLKAIPYTDKRFLWPIPVNDMVRNPTLAQQQNEGW